jgi:hypothetical protein
MAMLFFTGSYRKSSVPTLMVNNFSWLLILAASGDQLAKFF